MRIPVGTCTLATALLLAVLSSCSKHEIDIKPVEIKPIHITIDVNVKVDRALNDFFDDIDEAAKKDSAQ